MPFRHAMALINEIKVCVDLDHVDRTFFSTVFLKGADAWDVDGVIAANHHRQCTCIEDFLDPKLNVRMALNGLGVDDVRVSDVNDADIAAEIGCIIFMIIRTGMAE